MFAIYHYVVSEPTYRHGQCLHIGLIIIETALCKADVLTILLDTEPALLPVIANLAELFDCHKL